MAGTVQPEQSLLPLAVTLLPSLSVTGSKYKMPLRGPSPCGKCLREAKGVLGEQSQTAGSIPCIPSTLDLSLASLAAGGKLRHGWWRGSPHTQLGPAPCWRHSPIPAPGFAEGSRQQPQLCPQTGAGTGRGVTDRQLEARAAGGCSPRVPVSPRGAVPSQSCRRAAASSAPRPGAGSRGSTGRQGHSTWEGPCWAAPRRGLSQHHQPQRVLLPL